jgi:acyl dehydratase
MSKTRWIAVVFLGSVLATQVQADDIRPEARAPGARVLADEKCIEQCDIQSDKCMQDAGGDPGKIQVCDDKYSECLQACEGG